MPGPQQKGKIVSAGRPRAGMPGPYKCTHQTKKLLSPMPGDSSFYLQCYASTNVCRAQTPRTTMPRAMRYQPKAVKVCFLT